MTSANGFVYLLLYEMELFLVVGSTRGLASTAWLIVKMVILRSRGYIRMRLLTLFDPKLRVVDMGGWQWVTSPLDRTKQGVMNPPPLGPEVTFEPVPLVGPGAEARSPRKESEPN